MTPGRIVMHFFILTTFVMGAAALFSGSRLVLAGTPNMAGAITAVLMGITLTGVSIGYFYITFFRAPIVKARQDQVLAKFPGQPWMLREDWAARKLTSSTSGIAWLMWFWSAGWWFFVILIGIVNRSKIEKAIEESWWNVAMLALFVGVGLIGVMIALEFTRSTRRYGESTLELETLPFFAGETSSAIFTARLSPQQRSPLEMTVACDDVEWVTTGYGSSRRTRLVVNPISSRTTTIDTRSFVPTKNGMRGRVSIDIPHDLPGYSRDDHGNGVRWMLRIATTGDDEPFSCEFELPVFRRT